MKLNTAKTNAVQICIALIFGFSAGLSTTVLADGSKPVRYLSYENCGAYTVKNVKLHWKSNGETKSISVAANLEGYYKTWDPKRNGTCVDLKNESYAIPAGAEVWLSYNIEAGDSKNCRKDTQLIFDDSSKKREFQFSKGETLTNNRCRNRVYVPIEKPSECTAIYEAKC